MLHKNLFNKIISLENLFDAWDQFKLGKRLKPDVMQFELELEKNVFDLYFELQNKTYSHAPYSGFFITDPKLRHIHKATVRDRVVHHAVYNILYPIFEITFIQNSFSCRIGKGTHKGVLAVKEMLRKVSRNNTRSCYALKCDIRKFFDSVDQNILISILKQRIRDTDTNWLMERLIHSYNAKSRITRERNTNWKSHFPTLC
jgi:retron-type reverse transcriptase